jgi:hypothetical protein
MKGMYLCMFVAGLFFAGACQPAEPPFTDAEKDEIKVAVRSVFDTMVQGMTEHDADKIFTCYLKSDQLRYAGDGNLVSGWDDNYEMASTGHADPAIQEWSWSIDEVLIDVLTRDFAVVTARGKRNEVDEEGNESQRGYTVTDVFQRQESGWIIINEHESMADPNGSDT